MTHIRRESVNRIFHRIGEFLVSDDGWLLFVVALAVAVSLLGCQPSFDDESKSKLMKAEVLAVIFEPPEATPGETVKASYLIADENGPLPAPTQFWMPGPMGAKASQSAGDGGSATGMGDLSMMNIGMADLVSPSLEITIPTADALMLGENERTAQTWMLFSVTGGALDPTAFESDPMDLVTDGKAALTMRTLYVSTMNERNRNPRIDAIELIDASGNRYNPVLVKNDDESLEDNRRFAATNPIEVVEKTEWTAMVSASDPNDDDDALRYQWILTGVNFESRQKAEQPLVMPEYIHEFEEGQSDQRGKDPAAYREDPNLYPVWLIVRDTGTEGHYGQSWVEFYLRVIPAS